jgi:hypothetical protein
VLAGQLIPASIADVSEEDPYAPPATDEKWLLQHKAALREIVTGWEKLRLLYNAILLVPGIGVLGLWTIRGGMPLPVAVVSALGVAVGANVSFFLGPLGELYIRALFRNGESIGKGRWLIFGAGLVVSAGVFLIAFFGGVVVAEFPEPN